MAKTVFVLGAGASAQSGAPLMANFLDAAHDVFEAGNLGKEVDHFRRTFEAIEKLSRVHSKASLDTNNIEDVFTAFEMAQILGKFPGADTTEIPNIIASIKRVIISTIEQTQKFEKQADKLLQESVPTFGPPKPYPEFAEIASRLQMSGHSVAILSFNYDLAVEVSFHARSQKYDYCLGTDSPFEGAIPLLKLHGSLNWVRPRDAQPVRALPVGKMIDDARQMLKRRIIVTRYLEESEPLIVPPAWSKADGHLLMSPVWKRAALELTEAQNIVIIGYSMPVTDLFFRNLFALGCVGGNPIRNFMVSDISQNTQRYLALLGEQAKRRGVQFLGSFEIALRADSAMRKLFTNDE